MELHRVRTQAELDYVIETVREIRGLDDDVLVKHFLDKILYGEIEVLVGSREGKPMGCFNMRIDPPYLVFNLYRSRSKSFTKAVREHIVKELRKAGLTKGLTAVCEQGAESFRRIFDRAGISTRQKTHHKTFLFELPEV